MVQSRWWSDQRLGLRGVADGVSTIPQAPARVAVERVISTQQRLVTPSGGDRDAGPGHAAWLSQCRALRLSLRVSATVRVSFSE